MRPSVAVLLATYNGAAFCEAQMVSILWQREVDVHVYVRDDGSRDETPAILRAWVAEHGDRVTIVDNAGVSTGSANGNFFALLAALDCARHDFVAFADQDDVWTPDKLSRAIGLMVEEGADGYSSDLIAYRPPVAGDAGHAWNLRKSGRPADLDYLFQGASAGCTYVLSSRAAGVVQAVMADAPPFCPDPSHDWIVYAICRSRGMRWVRDPFAEILYRQHGGNQYGAKRGVGELIAKGRLLKSSWYRDHVLWIGHVVVGHPEERRVLDAVARGRPSDRWRLIRDATRFRRSPVHVAQLRIALAVGLL